MKKLWLLLLVTVVGSVLGGCVSVTAPKMTNNEKISLYFYCDKGITEDMSQDRVAQMEQVADFMQRHFLGYSSKAGYEPYLLNDRADFIPGAGHYLVAVKIKKYNAGIKALRIVVGFGAGAASMDIHYDLFADPDEPILSKDDGVGSSNPNWIVIPAKLNERMLAEVTKTISARL